MDNFSQAASLERKTESIRNLFLLTKEEQEILREKIKKNKGVVRIMIHPYYLQQKSDKGIEQYISLGRVAVVEEGFKKILQANTDTPIFLFETYDQIETTKTIVSKNLRMGNEIYIVPTFPDNSLPYFERANDLTGEEWEEFIKLIKNLGVEKIIIGGMHLITGEDRLFRHEDELLTGCVGVAVNNLKRSFDIQVSSITSPNSRKDLNSPDLKA